MTSEARKLTPEEVAQIRAIGRDTARGTVFPRWGWDASMGGNYVELHSTRRKHLLRAYHALQDAGWQASIVKALGSGASRSVRDGLLPDCVRIEDIEYWSWVESS